MSLARFLAFARYNANGPTLPADGDVIELQADSLGRLKVVASTSPGGASSNANTVSVTQASHGFTVGKVVYFNGTTWALASAATSATLSPFMVTSVTSANVFVVTWSGYVSGLSGITPGEYHFLSDTTAGAITTTEPKASYSNPILFGLTSTTGIVLPFRPSKMANGMWRVVSKTANYTAAAGDIVLCDSSGGAFTVTLPSAAGAVSQMIIIKKTSSDGYYVNISGTVDGRTDTAIVSQYDALNIVSNGTSWSLV